MRKITAGLFISLDGVVEAPDQWHFPYFNEEMGQAVGAAMDDADAMLMGRKLYQEWAEFWPKQGSEVPFADHNAMLDPECADITARILELLGYENWSTNHSQIADALEYIRKQQEPDGSWYGRWGVNYIYGTWQVLRGLRALKIDMNQPWLLKARDWLESVQHADGGWGERCNTYDDPVFKGQGPSTASQTAWAVMGLCAFDDPDRASLKRGIEYLIKTQNADGSWTELETTGTGFPKVFYLKYDMYRNAWPLLALATYRKILTGAQTRAAGVNGHDRPVAQAVATDRR